MLQRRRLRHSGHRAADRTTQRGHARTTEPMGCRSSGSEPSLERATSGLAAARARLDTVRAVAFDLKVFFSFVDKTPIRVTSSDVMAFITAQRNGDAGGKVVSIDRSEGLSPRPIRRRLSSVSGFYAYLMVRDDTTPKTSGLSRTCGQLGFRPRSTQVRARRSHLSSSSAILDHGGAQALDVLLCTRIASEAQLLSAVGVTRRRFRNRPCVALR